MIQKKQIRELQTAWLQEGNLSAPENPILLFLHGCPDGPETWRTQLEFFKKDYLVIAPFARGVGHSVMSLKPNRYSLESVALDHLEILRPWKNHKLCIIGHDIGAPYAWKLAQLLKDRLAGLVLINGPSTTQMARRLLNLRQVIKSWYIGMFQIPFLPELLLSQFEPAILRSALLKGDMPAEGRSSVTAIRPFLNQYRQIFKAIPRELRLEKINSPLRAPVLVLWGNQDAFLEVPQEEEMQKLSQNFTIRVLEGHHWLHHERSEQVNRLIKEFLIKNTKVSQ